LLRYLSKEPFSVENGSFFYKKIPCIS